MKDAAQYDVCKKVNTFTYHDLLLGSELHGRPLFITSYTWEQKVKQILVDGESTVDIMPKFIINNIGIAVQDLFKSWRMIQGFDLES